MLYLGGREQSFLIYIMSLPSFFFILFLLLIYFSVFERNNFSVVLLGGRGGIRVLELIGTHNKTIFWPKQQHLFFSCMKGKELLAAVLVEHKKRVSFEETQILTRGANSMRAGTTDTGLGLGASPGVVWSSRKLQTLANLPGP